ncbi:MAG: NADH-quinone oxidoreductase subunit J [Phycisphaerae bacterium]|nr:NADH-quinone oxidoreductase subunit J [Phycisphaerae bacterium]
MFRKLGGVIVIAAAAIFCALLARLFGGVASGLTGIYFWIFSAIALFGALRVVTHTRPVYSALYFVLTVFATSGLFLLMYAEFMAVALILIYAGAILITYLFVIMLAAEATGGGPGDQQGRLPLMGLAAHDAISREPIAASAVGFAMMGILVFVIFDRAHEIPPAPPEAPSLVAGATQELGEYLFRNQVANLELAGLILTVAMVGAIVIARKKVISPRVPVTVPESVVGPSTPIDDNPHSIPVYGTDNPRQKAFPET